MTVNSKSKDAVAAVGDSLVFRQARASDVNLLYDWRNDALTRAMSRCRDPIPYESHFRWFEAAFSDPEVMIFIAMVDGAPAGVLRFSRSADKWETHIAVAPEQRGQGLAVPILTAVSTKLGVNMTRHRSLLTSASTIKPAPHLLNGQVTHVLGWLMEFYCCKLAEEGLPRSQT